LPDKKRITQNQENFRSSNEQGIEGSAQSRGEKAAAGRKVKGERSEKKKVRIMRILVEVEIGETRNRFPAAPPRMAGRGRKDSGGRSIL